MPKNALVYTKVAENVISIRNQEIVYQVIFSIHLCLSLLD